MKLTNKYNLPSTIMNVIARPTYSKGKANLSVTELLNSPRIVQLKRKYWDDLEEDASSMVWSIFGTAIHGVLEHGKDENHIVEERIHINVAGMNISGAIDLQEIEQDGVVISDYKTTSAYAVMNEKQDWHNQLNCYAYLVEMAKGLRIKKLQIIAIVRDWTGRDVGREGYPQAPIVTIDIPLWSLEERDAYIRRRVHLHEDAFFESETDGHLSDCTSDEMWERPTVYALKKEGNVRAKSVHESMLAAEEALAEAQSKAKKGEKFAIEVREGGRVRCESYCQVSGYCAQYQNYLKGKS